MLSSVRFMPESKEISLGSLRLGAGNPLFLIAGPCVIESESHATTIAEHVGAIASELGISPRTVEVHKARIMEKLDCRSLADLIRMSLAPE